MCKDPLDQEKKQLRAEAKVRRAGAAAAAAGAPEALRAAVLGALDCGAIALRPGAVVSGYWPKGDELDPRPLMAALADRGHPLGLPVVAAKAAPLLFRAWAPGAPLEPAGFGLQVPPADQPEVAPELLLVPLLAFDRTGMRLGYGGGFYDRTLAQLQIPGRVGGPALAVGIAYAGQEMVGLPRSPTDRALDWVFTERDAIEIGAESRP